MSSPEAEDAEHYCWAVPVLNGPRTAVGTFGQVQVRCRCGWTEVVIAQVASMYGRHHYERHGVAPQSVPYGINGADD